MTTARLLFSGDVGDPGKWRSLFARRRPDIDFRIWPDVGDCSTIDYALMWRLPEGVLKSLSNLRAVFMLGAGVDHVIGDSGLRREVPIFRMIGGGMREQMTEYALYGVLHWHRNMGQYAQQQARREWRELTPVHPSQRTVGVMGLGFFGSEIASKLVLLGFKVIGWSRSRKHLPGVESYVGNSEFGSFLSRSEILINVLPLTADTRGLLNAELFARLPGGGALIHMGRGAQLNEADLIAALDSERLSWTMIDVFPTEPLPADNSLWNHPRILITPHCATQVVVEALEDFVIGNLERFERGEELGGRVNLAVGY